MTDEVIKEYKGDEVTVIWETKKCIHSGKCIRNLPGVFTPQERPWITVNNASTEKIIETVDNCPSKALTWKYNEKKDFDATIEEAVEKNADINILKNGPLLIKGKFDIVDCEGNVLEFKNSVALCRCGASANKPFCDGKHKDIDFKG